MPSLLRTALCCLGLAATALFAAPPPPDFLSPEVTADGQVTLRFYAPHARAVAVQGLRGRPAQPMSRDAAGLWSVTLSGLPADLYTYTFDVDGATALDPRNRAIKKWLRAESVFEVPAKPAAIYAVQPVPHGVLHRHTYASAAAGRETAFQVYTPPGYDPRATRRYPVVYLLHGFGDDETAWAENGRACAIADNLIAAGQLAPVIIVMPNGHPQPAPLVRPDDFFERNVAAMQRALLTEVLPTVEQSYAVDAQPARRAIVGLSMGGGQALEIGLLHPELFQWIGGFSSATPTGDLAAKFPRLQPATAPRLLWVGIGRDDFLLQRNEAFASWLRQQQIPFTWHLTDGGHEWTVWRAYLVTFLGRTFR